MKKSFLYIGLAILLLAVILLTILFLRPEKIVSYTVVFQDHDGTVLKTEVVEEGKAACAPSVPLRDGYAFVGWDMSFGNVTSDLTVVAQYSYISATDPTILVDKVTAAAGDRVQVRVSLHNNPGILGMTLRLEYDESAMTLTEAARGTAMGEITQFVLPKDLASGCQFPWATEEVLPEDATNGEILALTFEISDSVEPGDYLISITYEDGAIIDNDLVPVLVKIQNGGITVQ